LWNWLISGVIALVLIVAVVMAVERGSSTGRRQREQWGRQAALRDQIRDLVAERKLQGPLSGEIRFIGVKEASHVGPVYAVKASKVFDTATLTFRDDGGRLCFRGLPGHRGEGFVQPEMPNSYVPVEVSDAVVGLLNGVMGGPFGRRRLREASSLVSGAVPWRAHGQLAVGGMFAGDPDPFTS